MTRANRSCNRLPRLIHGAAAGLLGLTLLTALVAAAVEPSSKLTPETVRQLQTKYQQERTAADKEGLTKKFSPEWYERAAALAKQGDEALARDGWSRREIASAVPAGACRVCRRVCRNTSPASSAMAGCASPLRCWPSPTVPMAGAW